MHEQDFWSLIEASKLNGQGYKQRQLEWLAQTLEHRFEAEIIDFDRWFQEQMHKSYTQELCAAVYIIKAECSDERFDHFRAGLIAQGKEIFERVLASPDTLTDLPDSLEFESLLQVSAQAYLARTGRKLPVGERSTRKLTGGPWEGENNTLPEISAAFQENLGLRVPQAQVRIGAEVRGGSPGSTRNR